MDDLLKHYRTMLLIRAFETKLDQLFVSGQVKGTTHLCAGQEACAVGAVAGLRLGDFVMSNHRGHGHLLAKGGEPRRLMAELFGKADGYSAGRGGSQHMAAFDIGFLGSNGITGGGIPVATGAALSLQLKQRPEIVLCFFGDGATAQGTFHESLNLASLWRLPVIYLCENNLYSMSTPFSETSAASDVASRADAYGMPGRIVDGNNYFAVRDAAAEAAARARRGDGPSLLECKTYRHLGHSKSDMREYRTREEEQCWLDYDPIVVMAGKLKDDGVLSDADDESLRIEVAREVEDAVEFARQSPPPGATDLESAVFA